MIIDIDNSITRVVVSFYCTANKPKKNREKKNREKKNKEKKKNAEKKKANETRIQDFKFLMLFYPLVHPFLHFSFIRSSLRLFFFVHSLVSSPVCSSVHCSLIPLVSFFLIIYFVYSIYSIRFRQILFSLTTLAHKVHPNYSKGFSFAAIEATAEQIWTSFSASF